MREYMKVVEKALMEDEMKRSRRAAPKRPTPQTIDYADPVTPDLKIADPASKGALTSPKASAPAAPPGQRASREKTRATPINMPNRPGLAADFARHMGNLENSGLEDHLPDPEIDPVATTAGTPTEPVTPENLPQVINSAVFDPNDPGASSTPQITWHMVRNLPGYMKSAIRAMGRAVFAPFTDTPIEDIQVLSTMTNSSREVDAMAHWLTRHGIEDDSAELQFERIMPGYKADVKIFSTHGATFMCVKDDFGNYIYAWPDHRGVHLDEPAPMRRLNR